VANAALPDAPGGEVSGARTSEATTRLPTAALLCLAGAVACSGAVLLTLQSHITFLGDDWKFLLERRGFSARVFLDPHNQHLVLAPVSIYKALLAVFGMSSAMPFQVVSTLVFLLSAVLLFVYLRRRMGVWPALLGSILILFLGAAWSDLLWAFQIGFSGSVAAGLGALLALERDDRKGDLVACALLVLATSFSELGIPFVVGALVSVALGPSPRYSRLYVAFVPLALYGIWYLGWGHTGPQAANSHNLVNSPKFVFDSVSENLASLLGLATPLSGETGPNLGGLNWGRILLVIVIALAIWRLRRVGWPSRWLWAVLAAGGTFWFLTALNAIPLLRTATSGRYQYPGAIFVLLIAAELLRGVRLDRRVLAAAIALTVAVAISGLIFLHDGYRQEKARSDNERARLAAVEIGQGHESRDFVIGLDFLTTFEARSYFSAVDAFGSPAFSESQLAASKEPNRASADHLLAQQEAIKLGPVPPGAHQGARAGGRCHTLNESQSGSAALALGPGDYTLKARGAPGAQVNVVQLARFADAPSVDVGVLDPRAAAGLSVPPDRSDRPWRLYSQGPSAVTVCKLAQR
jgi:hypothetical protein